VLCDCFHKDRNLRAKILRGTAKMKALPPLTNTPPPQLPHHLLQPLIPLQPSPNHRGVGALGAIREAAAFAGFVYLLVRKGRVVGVETVRDLSLLPEYVTDLLEMGSAGFLVYAYSFRERVLT